MARGPRESWVFILDDIAMIALAIVSVSLLLIERTGNLSPSQTALFDSVDFYIALAFLAEFVVKLWLARNKRAYLQKNWWLLLASIPVTSTATQALRALRFLTVFRLVRAITGVSAIFDYIERFFEQTHVVYVLVTFALVVLGGAGAFEYFEYGINPAVHGYFDALWWAMCTVTTDSFGDIIPMTTGGRVVAMILMATGIGLAGTFTALVASFILGKRMSR
jgi:voltage-gated potassium channel